MKAMILAAGRGERMRPLTDSVPKPLACVAGRPLISYHLESLARAGIGDVVINLAWLGAQIRAALGEGERYGVRIRYSDEGENALESGGGIFNALPLLGNEPFLVINADTWTDLPFGELRIEAGADAHLVLVKSPPHLPKGDFGLEGDRVVLRDTERFTYSGYGVFRRELFAGCARGKFPLYPLLTRAIAAGRLRGHVYGGEWHEIGTVQLLAQMDARLRARNLQEVPEGG